MKTVHRMLAALAFTFAFASPALADTTIYPGTICTDGGAGTTEIPFTRGGVRVIPLSGASLSCPLPSPHGRVIQNVWVRIRRGNFLGDIMTTLWVLDSFGNHTGSAAQGRWSADHRNQSISYRIPVPSSGVSAPFGGYFLVGLSLNQGDEVVSIRVDTL